MLTYKLCHSYFNVAGPINVPAPVQYAFKLAKLLAEREEPIEVHPKLEETGLYFL
jgi:argonaute-like protein implicated in RNA metabolism and viral defense